MMGAVAGSAHIRTRETKSGRRFVVRFRLGGRAYPLLHGGSFKLLRLAKERRGFILGELAAGRDPRESLLALAAPKEAASLLERFGSFIASRVDVSASTLALYGNARDRLGSLADLEPQALTPGRVQGWIGELADLSPRTVAHYLSTLRQVLDFCDVEPNPARSRKVKLPQAPQEEVSPPSCGEWRALRDRLRTRSRLPLRLAEADGLRIGEVLGLRWGDVDFASARLRVSKARTKTSAGQRWLPVPASLLDEIAELLPLEDRDADRALFPGLSEWNLRRDMRLACRDAGIAHYHPHDLRHLRCSLLLLHGIDPVSLRVWTGHSRTSILQDVYGHVVLDPREDEWREFWLDVYAGERGERLGREAPVRPSEGVSG